MTKKEKTIAALLIASALIISSAYMRHQKDQRDQVSQNVDRLLMQSKIEIAEKKRVEKALKKCLLVAENRYYEYQKINATHVNDDGTLSGIPGYITDRADKNRIEDRELCFKLHGVTK